MVLQLLGAKAKITLAHLQMNIFLLLGFWENSLVSGLQDTACFPEAARMRQIAIGKAEFSVPKL